MSNWKVSNWKREQKLFMIQNRADSLSIPSHWKQQQHSYEQSLNLTTEESQRRRPTSLSRFWINLWKQEEEDVDRAHACFRWEPAALCYSVIKLSLYPGGSSGSVGARCWGAHRRKSQRGWLWRSYRSPTFAWDGGAVQMVRWQFLLHWQGSDLTLYNDEQNALLLMILTFTTLGSSHWWATERVVLHDSSCHGNFWSHQRWMTECLWLMILYTMTKLGLAVEERLSL